MVTKEDIKDVRKMYHDGHPLVVNVCADLLEARELINEMREQLSAVVSTSSTTTTKGELVYINNYIEMRELLEKTKDYA